MIKNIFFILVAFIVLFDFADTYSQNQRVDIKAFAGLSFVYFPGYLLCPELDEPEEEDPLLRDDPEELPLLPEPELERDGAE
jgi:hypothetical protein